MLNHVRFWLDESLFEILRDFDGLPGLYGLKCVVSMIGFVLVLL